ncbi:site-specific integrase [Roseomonas sp. 18066]|uniref:site-specific integrase n=1 Tax=Roseomonas sp. 18066 TaxID=2681412 RepID=UPI0013583A66|nr:site-specific integrase [Roseomonas sp. 18066]
MTEKPSQDAVGRAARLAARYRVAADAEATVRAYTADWVSFNAWCQARGVPALPAPPERVGDYLAELGEGYARATLRRKVAGIARAHRLAGQPLDTRHTAIREVLRGIGRTHGDPPKRAQALTTPEIQRLVAVCDDDLAGLRDRALLLLGFAGALRRSELCGIAVEHIAWKPRGLELLIPRSKTDQEGEGQRIGIPQGQALATCPVRALQAWLQAAGIARGPAFRGVTRHQTIREGALTGEALRLILLKRAQQAGIRATLLEPLSPHGLRAGFITTAYRAGIPDEEIMGHSRHRSLTTMRSYVRRSRLGGASPAGKVGL